MRKTVKETSMAMVEARAKDLAERRGAWPKGPWDKEPNEKRWKDDHSGYELMAWRNPTTGTFCGYVCLPPGHPWWGKHYDRIDVDVHGGLTFAAAGGSRLLDGDINTDSWMIGFDTAHYNDYSPGMAYVFSEIGVEGIEGAGGTQGTYRTLAYVEDECRSLAKQAKAAVTLIRSKGLR